MNDISRLPKWAQDHIADLKRERDAAIRALNEWKDDQTESPVMIPALVCTGERKGPSQKIRFIQTRWVEFEWEGIHLSVHLREGEWNKCIDLGWCASDGSHGDQVAMIPSAFQQVQLYSRSNMRHWTGK